MRPWLRLGDSPFGVLRRVGGRLGVLLKLHPFFLLLCLTKLFLSVCLAALLLRRLLVLICFALLEIPSLLRVDATQKKNFSQPGEEHDKRWWYR